MLEVSPAVPPAVQADAAALSRSLRAYGQATAAAEDLHPAAVMLLTRVLAATLHPPLDPVQLEALEIERGALAATLARADAALLAARARLLADLARLLAAALAAAEGGP